MHTSPRVASVAHKVWLVWDKTRSQQQGRGWRLPQLQWHGAAGSARSSGCLSGSSGGNRAAFGLIITLSVLSCTRGDIPGPANTLWNLGVVLGAIPSAKTKRVLSLKAISTLKLIALGARRPQQSSLQMPFVPAPLPTQAASSQAPVLGENLSLLSKSDREINTELSLLRRKKKNQQFRYAFSGSMGLSLVWGGSSPAPRLVARSCHGRPRGALAFPISSLQLHAASS